MANPTKPGYYWAKMKGLCDGYEWEILYVWRHPEISDWLMGKTTLLGYCFYLHEEGDRWEWKNKVRSPRKSRKEMSDD